MAGAGSPVRSIGERRALDTGTPPRGEFGAVGRKVRGHFLLKLFSRLPLNELGGWRTPANWACSSRSRASHF